MFDEKGPESRDLVLLVVHVGLAVVGWRAGF